MDDRRNEGGPMKHVCHDCHQPIPRGEAVLRAVSFESLAFHRECWALRLVPEQRTPDSSAVQER